LESMTHLSPAAQAILKAAYKATRNPKWQTNFYSSYAAAALRAAADQVVPEDGLVSILEDIIQQSIRSQFFAIAAELDGAALAQPEPQGAKLDCEEIDVPWTHRGDDFHAYREGYADGWTKAVSGRQSEPQEATDEEISDLWSWATEQDQGPWPTQQHCFARAVLARWHRPAIEPVPVAERLPGLEDCDGEGKCWFWADQLGDYDDDWGWKLLDRTYGPSWGASHWLPHHALLVPQEEGNHG
jgi:hypothetical protein